MRKLDKNYIILTGIALFFLVIVTPSSHLFGSTIDWVSQHIVFPDYFRKLFYETGNLFPNFAFSIGAGQNIFHFSYYGLWNPFIMLSYLLPFVDMTHYLIGMNVFLYIVSTLLLYKWFKRHFTKAISFLGSILFLCAAPILFHFHRHFMFVSYMPFLILGLIGVEDYFEKNKKVLLVISTFLILLTSYFYSIPSILVFILYGIFCYLKGKEKITFINFIKDGFCFLLPILLGVLLASFFLIPTFYTVLSGRGGGKTISALDLFLPKVNIKAIIYDHYGMGLTAIAVLSLFYGIFSRKRPYRFMSFAICILLFFPIFSYFLNGTLYIRNKVFIPFIPLLLYMSCMFLTACMKEKIAKPFYVFVFFSHIILFLCGFHMPLYYADAFLTLMIIWLIHRYKKNIFAFLFLLIPIGVMVFVNRIDKFVEKDVYHHSVGVSDFLMERLEKDSDIVRTYHLTNSLYNVNRVYGPSYHIDSLYSSIYNEGYRNFYRDTFKNPLSHRNRLVTSQNNNLLYQIYMGGKYMYGFEEMIGYKSIGHNVYQNDDVFPLFYVSNHLLNENEFQKLEYPYTIFMLMQNIIVAGKSKNSLSEIGIEELPHYFVKEKQQIDIKSKKDEYKVISGQNNKLTLSFNRELRNKIILLDFTLKNEWDCKKGDSFIIINGRSNMLTCDSALYKNENKVFHYVLSDPALQDLTITFAKGSYDIHKIHAYVIDYNDIKNIHRNFTKMKVDKQKSKGDVISGKVDVLEEGYFVTSLPYDEGFKVYDNGKKVVYERVNQSFLGFKIQKGKHNIQIKYCARGFAIGKCMSVLGILLFCILVYQDYKSTFIKNECNKSSNKKIKKV